MERNGYQVFAIVLFVVGIIAGICVMIFMRQFLIGLAILIDFIIMAVLFKGVGNNKQSCEEISSKLKSSVDTQFDEKHNKEELLKRIDKLEKEIEELKNK